MSIYNILIHVHSLLRWFLLLTLVYTVIVALVKWRISRRLRKTDNFLAALTMMFGHFQLLIGLALYVISPKVVFSGETMGSAFLRFFTVEHSVMMLIAITLLTIGNLSAKKAETERLRAKRIFWWFMAALIVIIAAIPWPSRGLGAGWI